MFGDAADIVWTTLTAAAGVAALSVAVGGWFLGPAGLAVRLLAGAAGLALLYADPVADAAGTVIAIAAGGVQLLQLQRKAA
jgi:TRAP-type uncharacterized transport system fused permease subunit